MFFLPASLLILAAARVFSLPLDKSSCTPSRLTLTLGPTYLNSPPIHNYCSHLFTPSATNKPSLPLEVSPTATATDVRTACECIMAMPQVPLLDQIIQQQGNNINQQQKIALFPPNQGKLEGVGSGSQPYGRGALPAPLGSELKGFGARDNLYVRGGIVDGTRARGS